MNKIDEKDAIDPFKNFTPRQNPPKPAGMHEAVASSALTDDELRAVTRQRLIQLLHDPSVKGGTLLAVCREVLDRLDGKPMQRQATLLAVTDGTRTFRDILDALDGKSTGLPQIEVVDGIE